VFQMRAPSVPRLTATSSVAFVAYLTGTFPPVWTSVALQFIAGALAYAPLRRSGLGGLLLASAVALFATFLGGWQAFVNYYYFVGMLLLLSAMTLAASPRSAALAANSPGAGAPVRGMTRSSATLLKSTVVRPAAIATGT